MALRFDTHRLQQMSTICQPLSLWTLPAVIMGHTQFSKKRQAGLCVSPGQPLLLPPSQHSPIHPCRPKLAALLTLEDSICVGLPAVLVHGLTHGLDRPLRWQPHLVPKAKANAISVRTRERESVPHNMQEACWHCCSRQAWYPDCAALCTTLWLASPRLLLLGQLTWPCCQPGRTAAVLGVWRCERITPAFAVQQKPNPKYLDVLLQHLDGPRHQHIPHLCQLLGAEEAALHLIHGCDAQCAGLILLQQLLQPRGRLLDCRAGLQAPRGGVAVAAECCGGALLAPLLIQLVGGFILCSVDLQELRVLQVAHFVVAA